MKIKRIYVSLTIAGVLASVSLFRSDAQTNVSEQTAPIAQPEDTYTAGENVEIKSDETKGDVAAAGANVTVAGRISGYLIAAGSNVSINGPIGNDVWAAGANVTLNNAVGDNAMLAGSSVVIGENGSVGGDARIAGSSVEIKGRINGELNIAAANVNLTSEVGGNVIAKANSFTLGPGAIVRGNLRVESPSAPTISPEAQVLGTISHEPPPGRGSAAVIVSWLMNWFLTFVWLCVLGFLLVWFSPLWADRVADTLRERTGRSFLAGLIVVLLVPVVFVVLAVTVVGIPLALLIGAASVVILLFSGVFVSYLVGEWLLRLFGRPEGSNYLKILVGALIVAFMATLPWVGWLASLAVLFFGAGAFLLERRDLIHILRERSLA